MHVFRGHLLFILTCVCVCVWESVFERLIKKNYTTIFVCCCCCCSNIACFSSPPVHFQFGIGVRRRLRASVREGERTSERQVRSTVRARLRGLSVRMRLPHGKRVSWERAAVASLKQILTLFCIFFLFFIFNIFGSDDFCLVFVSILDVVHAVVVALSHLHIFIYVFVFCAVILGNSKVRT